MKFILSRQGKKFRAALNLTGELEFSEGEVETVLEPTLGLAYRLNPHVALGVEGKTEMVLADSLEGPYLWAGPTLHLSGEGLWWTLSAIVGLTGPTREDAVVEARSMVGIEL